MHTRAALFLMVSVTLAQSSNATLPSQGRVIVCSQTPEIVGSRPLQPARDLSIYVDGRTAFLLDPERTGYTNLERFCLGEERCESSLRHNELRLVRETTNDTRFGLTLRMRWELALDLVSGRSSEFISRGTEFRAMRPPIRRSQGRCRVGRATDMTAAVVTLYRPDRDVWHYTARPKPDGTWSATTTTSLSIATSLHRPPSIAIDRPTSRQLTALISNRQLQEQIEGPKRSTNETIVVPIETERDKIGQTEISLVYPGREISRKTDGPPEGLAGKFVQLLTKAAGEPSDRMRPIPLSAPSPEERPRR